MGGKEEEEDLEERVGIDRTFRVETEKLIAQN